MRNAWKWLGLALLTALLLWQTVHLTHIKEQKATLHSLYETALEEKVWLTEENIKLEAEKRTAIDSLTQQLEQLRDQLQRENENKEALEQQLQETQEKLDKLLGKAPEGYEVAKVMDGFQATWYNYNSGVTFTGVPPVDGVTVAVDPSVIPLGTWLKLEFPDGREYVRKAQDTGSAVKGKIVDVYSTATTSELLKRGRTHGVKVYVLERGNTHGEG